MSDNMPSSDIPQTSVVVNLQTEKERLLAAAMDNSPYELEQFHIRIGPNSTQKARPWLSLYLAMRAQITLIIGDGGASKTMLVLMILFYHALGLPYGGWRPLRRCKVMVISGEENRNDMNLRLEGIARHYLESQKKKWTEKNLADLMFKLDKYLWIWTKPGDEWGVPSGPLVELDAKGNIKRTVFYHQVSKAVREHKPDYLYIDPLISMSAGFEEEGIMLMQEVVRLGRDLAVAGNCAVFIVHHSSQSGAKDITNQHASRGSTALPNGGRVQVNTMNMTEEEGSYCFPRIPSATSISSRSPIPNPRTAAAPPISISSA